MGEVAADRFDILRRLGAGAYGVVYEAVDRTSGDVVALKTLTRIDPNALYRFKREFRAIGGVCHTNLVRLHDLVADGSSWMISMELVRGVDCLAYVRANNVTDHVRLRSVLRQITLGLGALHDAGIIHRDIKPSNVLVDESGRVVIVDFGISGELFPDRDRPTDSQHIIGTPAYMAPEQASGHTVDQSADWYSMGVLLYEALTGVLPHTGASLQILTAKQTTEPAAPTTVAKGVPNDLNSLCVELLRTDPARRPNRARILALLGVEQAGSGARTTYQTGATPFIGRLAALETLHAIYADVAGGRPRAVLVHGSSGMGKSSTVRRFLEEAAANPRAPLIVSGRCYEHESIPFKAFDGVVDALARWLSSLKPADAAALLPRSAAALVRIFPVLERVEAFANAPRRSIQHVDPAQLRIRAFGAMRELLARISDQRPVVIFIDDFQWGDLDSAALVAELTGPPDPPVLMTIIGHRSEDADALPLATLRRAWSGAKDSVVMREVSLGSLEPTEARELAAILLGSDDALAVRVAEESGGSPFFIGELVRMMQSGVTRRSVGAIRLENLLRERLDELPDSARRLLGVVAVAGRPLRRDLAFVAAGLEGTSRAEAYALLRAGHLVRAGGSAGAETIEPYHDRVRETVVAMMEQDVRAQTHAAIARTLTAAGDADPESLFLHFRGAGRPERAAAYAESAGNKAARALAFERAAQYFRAALELTTADDPRKGELLVAVADALANAGRGADAADAYVAAAEHPDASAASRLELRRRAAENLLFSGYTDRGVALFANLLSQFGAKIPATPIRALITLILLRAWLRIRGVDAVLRDETAASPAQLTRIDVCQSIGEGLGVVNTTHAAVFQARAALLALSVGEPVRICRALALQGAFLGTMGHESLSRAHAILDRAEVIATKLGRGDLLVRVVASRAFVAQLNGQWRRAWNGFEKSIETYRDSAIKERWYLDIPLQFGAAALYFLGDFRELERRVAAYLREAEDLGDLWLATNLRVGYSNAVWLAKDDPDYAREMARLAMAQWSREGFQVQHFYEMHALAQADLYEGKAAASVEVVESRWPSLERSLVRRVRYTNVVAAHLRGRCAVAAFKAGLGERHAKTARAMARSLAGQTEPWGEALGQLLRVCLASAEGDRDAVLRTAPRVEESLRGYDMTAYAAAARCHLGFAIGGDEGRAMVDAAIAETEASGVRDAPRFLAMIAPGASF